MLIAWDTAPFVPKKLRALLHNLPERYTKVKYLDFAPLQDANSLIITIMPPDKLYQPTFNSKVRLLERLERRYFMYRSNTIDCSSQNKGAPVA